MATPVPSAGQPKYPLPDPIGEVQVLVYAWEPGKTEVRVKFPTEASGGTPAAVAKQVEFRNLVLAELDAGLKALTD